MSAPAATPATTPVAASAAPVPLATVSEFISAQQTAALSAQGSSRKQKQKQKKKKKKKKKKTKTKKNKNKKKKGIARKAYLLIKV